MGWWGFDVMEGDAPMDLNGTVVRCPPQERLSMVLELAKTHPISRGWVGIEDTATQVWGYAIMYCGMPMTSSEKEAIAQACSRDEWSKTQPKRRAALAAFTKSVMEYDGETEWEPTSKGLIDTLHEAAERAPGPVLINVGPEIDGLS